MQDNLPKCDGDHATSSWTDHGGTFSPMGCSRWRKCDACGAMALEVSRKGGALFLIAPTEEDIAYINGPLDIVWRARAAKVQMFRDARWFAFAGASIGREVTHEGQLDEWPLEERRATYDAFVAQTMMDHGRDPDQMCPAGCYGSPQPAQCPASWERRAYVYCRPTGGIGGVGAWWAIDTDACAALPIPPDPRREATEVYFATVWAKVESATGVAIVAAEAPNGYYDDTNKSDPWWTFGVDGAEFTVGWRKRVVNITARGLHGTRRIAKIAKADNVTFSGQGSEVTVHAWTQDKVVEYLVAMLPPPRSLAGE